MFCRKEGEVLKENETIKFPKLGQTYKRIAEEGPDAFYQGTLAQSLVDDIQAKGNLFFDCLKKQTSCSSYPRLHVLLF